jgi:hypothetical protein
MSTYHELVDVGLPLVLVNGYSPSIAVPQISDDDVAPSFEMTIHGSPQTLFLTLHRNVSSRTDG